MTEITVPCATCSGTGDATHGDRHTSTNMDRCRTCGGTSQVPARPGESRETSWPFAVPGAQQPGPGGSFQARVDPWLIACFGEEIARDKQERAHRFLEEALELVQAAGCTAHEAHQLVDYVYGRPAGEMAQEVGGVMTTLAAFCLAHGLDMHEAGETELARIWTKVEKIRAKQAAKPKHSPLPEASPGRLEADHDKISRLIRERDEMATQAGACAEEVDRIREESRRLRIALHDAIRRPLGVTPDSALEFYDPRMADEAEVRRAGGGRL